MIATDGMENSSREYNRAQIQEIIKRQQEVYDWQILFIGANMNASSRWRRVMAFRLRRR